MRDELLAYLLDDLEPEKRERIERRLETDPIWQHELERLRSCLDAGDQHPEGTSSLPENLANRTCSFVKDAISHGSSHQEPSSSLTEAVETSSRSSHWSLADMVIAASVLMVVGMLLVPALRSSRESARRSHCQNNLRLMGTALVDYAGHHGGLPAINRGENTGSFVMELADRGYFTRQQLAELLVCPSTELADNVFSGTVVMRVPTRKELALASTNSLLLRELHRRMSGSYAYRVGYVDRQGTYHQVKFVGTANQPLLADAPSSTVPGFQSANHGGCGQNVVAQDLSSRYHRHCIRDLDHDHFYLNAANQHAPGMHPNDVVLGLSELTPHTKRLAKGKIVSISGD